MHLSGNNFCLLMQKIENFIIEDNILKGVDQNFGESYNIGEHLLVTLSNSPDHVAQVIEYTYKYIRILGS